MWETLHTLQQTASTSFKSEVTKRSHNIRQLIDCTSKMVVYLVTCKKCQKQGVGSTDDFYQRLSNYKSNIISGKNTCCIEGHFLDRHHSFEDFEVIVIAKLENIPVDRKALFTRLRKFEGYWQMELCTIKPRGMNSLNEYQRNKYAQEKPSFTGN